jgi:hypothetical protein
MTAGNQAAPFPLFCNTFLEGEREIAEFTKDENSLKRFVKEI